MKTDMRIEYADGHGVYYGKDGSGDPVLYVGVYLWGKDIDEFIEWAENIKTVRSAEKITAQSKEPS